MLISFVIYMIYIGIDMYIKFDNYLISLLKVKDKKHLFYDFVLLIHSTVK